jgi:EpsI family protein
MTRRLLVLSLVFALAAMGIVKATDVERVPARESFKTFPRQVEEFQSGPDIPFDPEILKVVAVDDYLNRVYVDSRRLPVGLYVGYYQSQREGDTIHSPLNCLPGAGWEPMQKGRIEISRPGRESAFVNEIVIQKGIERQVVLYWYQSHGRIVASEYWGRAFMALDALRLNRTDGAMVRVVTSIDDRQPSGLEPATVRARAFAGFVLPKLDKYLPG